MTAQSLANNATTTLSGDITNADTSLTVASASLFPSSGNFTILIGSEYLLVTSGQGTTTWGVTRAQEGSAAAAHTSGTAIEQTLTKGAIDSLNQGYWPYFQPSSNTGATQQARYFSGTATNAPTTGTWAVRDVVVDGAGHAFICTVAGTPGTWRDVGLNYHSLFLGCASNGNPAASKNYDFSSFAQNFTDASLGSGIRRVYIPVTGIITAAYAFERIGTVGSAQTSTLNIRLNDTTNTVVSSAITSNTASSNYSNTALSIAVVAGDYICMRWATPAWTTAPLNVNWEVTLAIKGTA